MARSKASAPKNPAATVKDIEEMATRIGLQFMRKNASLLLNLAAREDAGSASALPKRRRKSKKPNRKKARMMAMPARGKKRGPGRPPKPKG